MGSVGGRAGRGGGTVSDSGWSGRERARTGVMYVKDPDRKCYATWQGGAYEW